MLRSAHRLAFVALCAGATAALAKEHPIVFAASVAGRATRVRPGERLTVRVTAAIPDGWHLYALTEPAGGPIATTLTVGPPRLATLAGPIGTLEPTIAPDKNFDIVTEYFEDSAAFSLPVAIDAIAATGSQRLEILVGYQTCNARY